VSPDFQTETDVRNVGGSAGVPSSCSSASPPLAGLVRGSQASRLPPSGRSGQVLSSDRRLAVAPAPLYALDIERRLIDTGRRFAEMSGERDKARQELYAAIRKAHREGLSIRPHRRARGCQPSACTSGPARVALSSAATPCPFRAHRAENRGVGESQIRPSSRTETRLLSQVEATPASPWQVAGLGWGTRGPEFKSRRPDREKALLRGPFL
jgi:hypothetical protein